MKRLAPSSLPAVLTAGSFFGLIILVLSTRPTDKVGYAMIFFLLLLLCLSAGGYLLLGRFKAKLTAKDRYRIVILALFLTILLMFRSAQSLGWLDLSVLVLVSAGLWFYSGRR